MQKHDFAIYRTKIIQEINSIEVPSLPPSRDLGQHAAVVPHAAEAAQQLQGQRPAMRPHLLKEGHSGAWDAVAA